MAGADAARHRGFAQFRMRFVSGPETVLFPPEPTAPKRRRLEDQLDRFGLQRFTGVLRSMLGLETLEDVVAPEFKDEFFATQPFVDAGFVVPGHLVALRRAA